MKTKKSFLWLAFLILATIWILVRRNQQNDYNSITGFVFGTVYNITYQYKGDLSSEIEAELKRFDFSLSPFNDSSVISRVNRNEELVTDTFFQKCFNRSMEISRETKGAFDITVAPLANAWGFGFKQNSFPDSARIDTLRQFVGMDLLTLTEGKLQKKYPEITLDASSIAKGLGVDLVAEYFERKGLNDYMVEIGGEVRAKGQSSKKRPWRIGIDRPEEDVTARNRRLQMIAGLSQGALATSGNYRNFYVHDGKKYAHTINPKTGYPVQTEVLSASVYAPTCMEADAYATAFMVLGLQKARQIVLADPELEGAFIYLEEGKMKNWISPGFEKLIVEK